MITLLIICLISFFTFFILFDPHKRRKTLIYIISLCLSGVICIVSLSAILFSMEFVVNDSYVIATIIPEVYGSKKDSDDSLHYDVKNDKYFTVEFSYLNPFTPISRQYIETENAKAYIEVYNKLAEIELN